MKPVLPLMALLPLLVLAAGAAAFMAWRGTEGSAPRIRIRVLGLRMAAIAMLAVMLLNPGRWESLRDVEERVWALLVDQSASMAVEEEEGRRIEAAGSLAEAAEKLAAERGITLESFGFDERLLDRGEGPWEAAGKGTGLVAASEELLTRFAARGRRLAGVVVVSDGRQTARHPGNNLALRARAEGTTIHAVVVGGAYRAADIALRAARPAITAFGGQDLSVAAVLESAGMGPVRAPVRLLDEAGEVLAEAVAETGEAGRAVVVLAAKAPEESAAWKLATGVQDGESRSNNNEAAVYLRVIKSKTRVFMAEGAPYWDSKFLAQMLRQQEHIEMHSVYQLSPERFFRIDTGVAEPVEASKAVFPDTVEELSTYDLVVFGKNVDAFLTPERQAALVDYVRDGGGAVLFSRGRAYTAAANTLEIIEPVTWAAGNTSEFRLLPSADGEAAGLFGQALPGPEAGVWRTLPFLKDARRIDRVKPFTRVLAEGQVGSGSLQGRFPLVLVRRYGQGVSGLVNADGMWKWDFYPEAKELGNMYLEFWSQLIQWMSSYSEFLPGQDYSLKLSRVKIRPGEVVGMNVSYRGEPGAAAPRLEVASEALGEPMALVPGGLPPENGRPRWRATFRPERPGVYSVALVDERPDAPPVPEAVLTVEAPPAERDELSADPEFLGEFAAQTGGTAVALGEGRDLLEEVLVARPPDSRESDVEWRSWWKRLEFPFLLAGVLGLEWWLRRRNGMI